MKREGSNYLFILKEERKWRRKKKKKKKWQQAKHTKTDSGLFYDQQNISRLRGPSNGGPLISILSAHILHIKLNTIFYTHVEHSPTKKNLHTVLI